MLEKAVCHFVGDPLACEPGHDSQVIDISAKKISVFLTTTNQITGSRDFA